MVIAWCIGMYASIFILWTLHGTRKTLCPGQSLISHDSLSFCKPVLLLYLMHAVKGIASVAARLHLT